MEQDPYIATIIVRFTADDYEAATDMAVAIVEQWNTIVVPDAPAELQGVERSNL